METITKVNASGIDERLEVPSRRSSTVLWRLNNKSANVRQQAADLTTRLAVMIKQCGEVQLLSTLGLVLFEQLGKEYPDTRGAIANGGELVFIIPYRQLLMLVIYSNPNRMTPILRNHHEKVQGASMKLIDRIDGVVVGSAQLS